MVAASRRLVTDAEVFREIPYRSTAIGRRDAIQPVFAVLLAVVDSVFPIELEDIERAKAIVLETRRLSSRTALHVAIMERQGVSEFMTLDRGFADRPGIRVVGG